jgi:hypothetical protein
MTVRRGTKPGFSSNFVSASSGPRISLESGKRGAGRTLRN